jgi:hypothetical protein
MKYVITGGGMEWVGVTTDRRMVSAEGSFQRPPHPQ